MYERWSRWLCYLDLTTGTPPIPSFSKLVCAVVLVASIVQHNLTLGIVIAILASSFGRSTFIAFLKRSSIAAAETQVVNHQILERRDAASGVEPA